MSETVSHDEFRRDSVKSEPVVEIAREEPVVDLLHEEVSSDAEELTSEPVSREKSDIVVKKSYEEEARDKGWKPKEEFEGDPEDWAPAKAWLKTGEILDSLNHIKRESRETKEAMAELAKQNAEVERKSYEKAYKDAELRQARAAEIGDVKAVQAVTRELMDLAPKAGVSAPEPAKGETAEASNFKFENRDWFNQSTPENTAMQAYAIAVDREVAIKYKELSNSKKLELVKDEVKKAFPHRFESPAPKSVREVIPPSAPIAKRAVGDDFSKLSDHHKRMIKKLERDLGSKFDKSAYIKNVKIIGDM